MNETDHDITGELKLMRGGGYEIAADTSKKGAKSGAHKDSGKEVADAGCRHHMGYLKTRSKDEAVPDTCLTCSKILQCMV